MKPKCICDKLFTNIYNKLLLAFISLVKFYVQNKYLIYDTILDVCIEKQRHYIANKGPSSQGYSFSSGHVWMWELDCEESWAPKNWCFWTGCWRRLLRVPWTARRSNQSIVKEISPGISLEGMMLKLKLQYFGHLMRRVDSLEKTLILGGIGGRRRRGRQRMR